MKNIASHIETLLKRHDYVIVPDFGGFTIQAESALIHKTHIGAPYVSVSFNPLLHISDGLLAIEISRAENKTFREAAMLIEAEVASFKNELNAGKKVLCGNLGSFSKANDKLHFSPSLDLSLLPANYGLNNLYYTPAETGKAEERQKTIVISLPKRRNWSKYAAVSAVIAALFFSSPKLNDARHHTANLNPVSLINILPSQDTQTEIPVEPKKFHVIVSTMETAEEAGNLVAYLKNKNFTNASVFPAKKFRVSIESFLTKEEAVSYMENLRQTSALFPDAWVYCEN